MKRLILIIFSFCTLLSSGLCSAQEFKVKSMEIKPTDLTARVGKYSRVDLEGEKTALLKIYVPDDIAEAQGNVVGDVVKKGFEKWVYVSNGTKQVKLLFENHYPLMITFGDYNYPSVSEQMVYEIKLVEDENGQPTVKINPIPTTAANPTPATSPSATPAPAATNTAEILAEAKKAYDAKEYAKAMQLYRKIDSDKTAQYYIGAMYFNGWGVATDAAEGLRWTRRSAEQGDAIAQFVLGIRYEVGYGVAMDEAEAVRWYRLAAEQGMEEAKKELKRLGY